MRNLFPKWKGIEQGFTLIELLVVIAIIGLLSSIVLASLSSARARARDVQRVAELREVQNSLEEYYNSNGSYPLAYPTAWGGVSTGGCGSGNGTASGPAAYISGLTPTYMGTLPVDPSNPPSNSCQGFLYNSNGVHYKLLSHNIYEESYPTAGQAFYDPERPTWALMVTDDPSLPPGGCGSIQWSDSSQTNTYGGYWPVCW